MIHTKDLETVIALSLASAYVKGETPQSLMIVSERPESGKTQLAYKFSKVDGIAILSDGTAKGIMESLRSDLISGSLKHLIIPEFLAPISRNQSTVNSFLATIQMLIEEGIQKIDTGLLHQKYDNPKQIGVIACLPRPAYLVNRVRWLASGLLSRFLLMTFRYSNNTVDAIFDSIMSRQYLGETNISLNFNEIQDIELPQEIAQECKKLALETTERTRTDRGLYGFRQLESLQRMVMAKVVLDKAQGIERGNIATINDFNVVKNLGYLFNEQFNEVRE